MAERRLGIRPMLYLAVFIALAATVGAYRALLASRADAQPATRSIVVVTRDIPQGMPIERSALGMMPWPAATVPAGSFATLDSVVGRIARVPMLPGDPIVPARLAARGSGAGLEVMITPGKRAMAVRIDDVAGLSGMIQPNARVDVLVTLRTNAIGDQQVAKVFLENLRVLSIGTKVERGERGEPIDASTATLEVTPEEAERLALAMNQGSIQLVLRAYGDPSTITTSGARSADVLAQLRVTPAAPVVDPAPGPAPARAIRRPPPPRVAPVAAQPAPQPVAPPRRDTAVVRVYRGNADPVVKKFERPDTIRPRTP